MIDDPKELNDYHWAGHSAIIGEVKRGWRELPRSLSILVCEKRLLRSMNNS
jgi:hypothetical protein